MTHKAKNEKSEAERIYRAIFRTSVPPVIEKRFYRACEVLFSTFSHEEQREYVKALEKVSDLEALELAARKRRKLPLVVSRFRLMVYLAETLPQNQGFFIQSFNKKGHSFFSLSAGGIRTSFKFIKGWFLLKRI